MDDATLIWWILAAGLVLVGMAGVILPMLPGLPFVMMGLGVAAWADHFARVGAITLTVLGLLTAAGLVLDFIAGGIGAKRVGASPLAVTGASVGSIVGIFFGLPGLILGPFIGAVLGELKARGGLKQAASVGVAAWIGLLLGTVAKLAIGLAMLGIFGFVWFF